MNENDVFILGAGFSRAISSEMPLMNELSCSVKKKLAAEDIVIPKIAEDADNNIESWITFLSQRQPHLRENEYHENQALIAKIREKIAETIEESIREVIEYKEYKSGPEIPKDLYKFEMPPWLRSLIVLWHETKTTVITLNYDILVEAAVRKLQCPGPNREPAELQVVKDILETIRLYPDYFSHIPRDEAQRPKRFNTFLYLKLHGSVNWYYSGREDFYGEKIYIANINKHDCHKGEQLLEVADKEQLVVPPVYEKTGYFNNESIRRIWREARSALEKAKNVYVIGYSLPPSDMTMRHFLANALRVNRNKPKVYIIDRSPETGRRYNELLSPMSIEVDLDHETYISGQNAVAEFVEKYRDIYYADCLAAATKVHPSAGTVACGVIDAMGVCDTVDVDKCKSRQELLDIIADRDELGLDKSQHEALFDALLSGNVFRCPDGDDDKYLGPIPDMVRWLHARYPTTENTWR